MLSLLFPAIDRLRAPAPDGARVAWLGDWAYAHRGLHMRGSPENSPSAFADAIKAGLGIECDVQRTGDGRAAVFHDWDLGRLTDRTGPLAQMTMGALEQIALRENGDMIPRLERLLDQVDGRVPILIELKSRRDNRVRPLCLAVRRALEGYAGAHAVMSFDPQVSRWFSIHAPKTVRGLVMTEGGPEAWNSVWARHAALWRAKPDFLAYDIRNLPSRFAQEQRERGLPILTWTVASAQARAVADAHADAPIVEGEGANVAGFAS